MPRGAFLVQPVGSVWQLKTQIQSVPVVAARYEKHFACLRHNLRVMCRASWDCAT